MALRRALRIQAIALACLAATCHAVGGLRGAQVQHFMQDAPEADDLDAEFDPSDEADQLGIDQEVADEALDIEPQKDATAMAVEDLEAATNSAEADQEDAEDASIDDEEIKLKSEQEEKARADALKKEEEEKAMQKKREEERIEEEKKKEEEIQKKKEDEAALEEDTKLAAANQLFASKLEDEELASSEAEEAADKTMKAEQNAVMATDQPQAERPHLALAAAHDDTQQMARAFHVEQAVVGLVDDFPSEDADASADGGELDESKPDAKDPSSGAALTAAFWQD